MLFCGHGHAAIVAHVAHARLAHRHVAGQQRAARAASSSPGFDADHVRAGRGPSGSSRGGSCGSASPSRRARRRRTRCRACCRRARAPWSPATAPPRGCVAAVGLGDAERRGRGGGSGGGPSRSGCRGGCARARRAARPAARCAGNALPFIVSTLKSVISFGSGLRAPGLDRPLVQHEREVAVDARRRRRARDGRRTCPSCRAPSASSRRSAGGT